MSYGEGAVMGVPAHDERDFEFAHGHGIAVRTVVRPVAAASDGDGDGEKWSPEYAAHGVTVDSGEFSGLGFDAAVGAIGVALATKGLGQQRVQWRLRDCQSGVRSRRDEWLGQRPARSIRRGNSRPWSEGRRRFIPDDARH